MPNLIVLAGVPGCGKSTWAKQFFDLKCKIVSADTIREREYGSRAAAQAVKGSNAHVFALHDREIEDALSHGVDVVVDNTSLHHKARAGLLSLAEKHGADPHLIVFKNVQEALDRNRNRRADHVVPDDVMERMMTQYYDMLARLPQEDWKSVTKIEAVR